MKRQNFNKIRNINDKVLMSLESEAKDYRVTVEERLYFLVKSNGNKYWQVKYKNIKGKWSLKSIGTFPMVNLSQAIEKLEKFLSELKKVDASNKKDVKDKKY
ncbi:Arm DNA-binding domain-containing protein, partial [Acinetobacter pecorum]